MRSEGQIFRKAYGKLDRLAPPPPDFDALGTIRLTSAIPVAANPSRWLMGMAATGVVIVVALVPALILGPANPFTPSGAAPTTVPPVATTIGCDPTTTTISPTGETGTTGVDQHCAPDTTITMGTTTTTIGATLPTLTTIPACAECDYQADDAAAFLFEFLALMRDGFYENAQIMYGGPYDQLAEWNPTVDPDDRPALLEAACNHQLDCRLVVGEIVANERDGDIFSLTVTFVDAEGRLVILWEDQDGTQLTEWQFRVVVDQGILRVLDLPVYVP